MRKQKQRLEAGERLLSHTLRSHFLCERSTDLIPRLICLRVRQGLLRRWRPQGAGSKNGFFGLSRGATAAVLAAGIFFLFDPDWVGLGKVASLRKSGWPAGK